MAPTEFLEHRSRRSLFAQVARDLANMLTPVGEHPVGIDPLDDALAQTFHTHSFGRIALEHGDVYVLSVIVLRQTVSVTGIQRRKHGAYLCLGPHGTSRIGLPYDPLLDRDCRREPRDAVK